MLRVTLVVGIVLAVAKNADASCEKEQGETASAEIDLRRAEEEFANQREVYASVQNDETARRVNAAQAAVKRATTALADAQGEQEICERKARKQADADARAEAAQRETDDEARDREEAAEEAARRQEEQRWEREQREAEERREEARAADAQAYADRVARLAKDPKLIRTPASMLLCRTIADKAVQRGLIADEKRSARDSGGGMEDGAAIYGWQQTIRIDDAQIAYIAKRMKSAKVAALACTASPVKRLSTCYANPDAEDCEALADLVFLANQLQGELNAVETNWINSH
jgi:hypothetical protein